MKNTQLKILTFILFIFLPLEIFAAVINQLETKTHLRWNLSASKKQLVINKRGNKVLIQTLNQNLFTNLKKDLEALKLSTPYLKGIKAVEPNENKNVSSIEVDLKDDSVEIFTFYKDRDKMYVIDFWKESDEVNFSDSAVKKKKEVKSEVKPMISPVAVDGKKSSFPPVLKRAKSAPVKKKIYKKIVKKKSISPYRDFRYGAAFIWDYPSLTPKLKNFVNLTRKTPEYFYPIKNVNYEKSEKEAHLQLCINLYRKKKWGLMNKSIKLFQKKYGDDQSYDLLDYLKANALLRENFKNGNSAPVKMAMTMFSNIAELTKTYEMKKAIYKYLLQDSLETGEYVTSLKYAKKFYVSSKENFDYEESRFAVEAILYSLAKLNQVDKIREVIKEKTITKLLPKQILIDYEMYAVHKLGKLNEVIKIYKKNAKGLSANVRPGILFNVAEAYFRKAEYEKAKIIFDQFMGQYSYHHYANYARMRIAQIFDLTGRNADKTLLLYKTAINRVQDKDVLLEAKIRYVALRTVRKRNINAEDRETRVFMELKSNEKKNISKENKKLLWLTRLRTFIVDGKFEKALAYLKAIPLNSMTISEQRVFEADGAEIVYGILQNFYQEAEYSNVVKAWEIYKKKYVAKVANDPFLNFIVGSSYIKLGLFDSYERIYNDFSKLANEPIKTFPVWVERNSNFAKNELLSELNIIKSIKLKNWKLVPRYINALEAKKPHYNHLNYYKGIVHFNQKDYFKAAQDFEQFLAYQDKKVLFDPADLAEMIQNYTDSLYELGKIEKYKSVAKAVLEDTKTFAPNNPFIKSARERISYLVIEITAGEATASSYLELEPQIINFKRNFPKSVYSGRINYLLGYSLIKNNKLKEGKAVYRKLLGNADVSNYIKELVKSELSLLTIKEKTL